MRMCVAALLGLLSLVALGCAGEVTTTEQRIEAQIEVREADAAEAPPPPQAPTETPTEAPAEAPTETPTEASAEAPTAAPTEAPAETASDGDGLFPTVVGATASSDGGSRWNVSVTLSSEYDTRDRYADAWRVLDGEDNELGIRVLGHDHANEQPFTRSTSLDIADDIEVVYIEGRDQINGWSGERFELQLSR